MNDDEVIRLSHNCKKMLSENGQVILRNVTLKEGQSDRMVYNYRPNFINYTYRDDMISRQKPYSANVIFTGDEL